MSTTGSSHGKDDPPPYNNHDDDEDMSSDERPIQRPSAVASPSSRFGHFPKYTKPKIGPTFQCAVPKFVPTSKSSTTQDTEGSVSGSGSIGGSSVAASSVGLSSATGKGRGGRGRGRGGRGRGRGRGGRGRTTSVIVSGVQEVMMESAPNMELTDPIAMANAAADQLQDNYGKRIIPRGGICIHKPSQSNHTSRLSQQDDFLMFSRNLFLQTPRPYVDFDIDEFWDSAAERVFSGEKSEKSDSGAKGKKKRATKRKASAVDESVDEDSIRSGSSVSRKKSEDGENRKMGSCNEQVDIDASMLPLCGLEDDDRMLSFLQSNHRGDSHRAKLSAMVNMDRGYGVHRRRAQRKKQKAETTYSDPTTFTSESWRWRLHQARPMMLGDLRAQQNTRYEYFSSSCIESHDLTSTKLPWRYQQLHDSTETATEGKVLARTRSGSIDWTTDQLEKAKKIWNSILQFTNDVLGVMENLADPKKALKFNEDPRPLLSDLLVLVTKAHALPTPEETFGRRDPSLRVISQNMNAIIDAIEVGRDCTAKLLMQLKDDGEGVELPTLQKSIAELEQQCPVKMPDIDTAKKQMHEASLWEEALENNVDCDADSEISDGETLLEKKQTLVKVERLIHKGRNLTLRPRSLVRLENRVERAHVLRRKIIVWNEARNQENPQNIKFIAGLIKEANKIDLMFPEMLTLTGVHKKAEDWMDRASIAIRTTISFDELEALVTTGKELPINVSDLLEKLEARLIQAQEWIDRVGIIVPQNENNFIWLKRMRSALNDRNDNAQLLSLVSDGTRVPVDMDCLKLLQIEIDARNWSMKCMPWIPSRSDDSDGKSFRRGKVDDVQDHLDKAANLRDRLWFGTDDEKSAWILEGEEELSEIMEQADTWFDKYDDYISQDNRSKKNRVTMSLSKLRKVVEEANKIPLNLGNSATKMNRIFLQAEEWVEKYYPLLTQCGIECSYIPPGVDADLEATGTVHIYKLQEAVSDADSELSIDLEEVVRLKEIVHKAQVWIEKSSVFYSENETAGATGKNSSIDEKHSMEEMVALISEASTFPVDISNELNLLKIEQSKVIAWRIQMQRAIKEIISSFGNYSRERESLYLGNVDRISSPDHNPQQNASLEGEPDAASNSIRQNVTRQQSKSRSNSFTTDDTSHSRATTPLPKETLEQNAFPLVTHILKSVKSMKILTPESLLCDELSGAMTWLTKSFKFLSSHMEAFERKNSSALDKLIKSGQALLKFNSSVEDIPEHPTMVDNLRECWASIVNNDLDKLVDLKERRSKFFDWCGKADEIISDANTKIEIEALQKLNEECASYPSTSEVVIRVRHNAKEAFEWLTTVQSVLKSGRKISMDDAKQFINKGESLNLSCSELKTLRGAMRTTKSWLAKVKKCGAENGETAAVNVNELIDEHNSFLVTAIGEVERLKQATCGYCICRLPYEGFMIGCDGCEEWYHGTCVGLSEEQANKVDKYVCLRCSTVRIYKENAVVVSGILRKWSSSKGLSKARLMDTQRYTRKVRTCEKDMAKAKENLQKWSQSIDASNSGVANGDCQVSTLPSVEGPKVSVEPTAEQISIDELNSLASKQEKEVQEKIEKARTTLENCEKRMEGYTVELAERTNLEARENSVALTLKTWCQMVKRDILSPLTQEEADQSRPRNNDHTSIPIENAKTRADALGIANFPDVGVVLNSFKVFAWCLHLLEVLRRKPMVEEIRSLLAICVDSSFKIPESKCIRMLRSISSRALIWQSRAKKALAADSKAQKPYDLVLLRQLLLSAKEIPVTMPEEARLLNTIEDKGCRHCICGGPSDGSFMLGCDNCDKWFHGSCMKLDKAASDALVKWICPPCSGKGSAVQVTGAPVPVNDKPVPVLESSNLIPNCSPHAPNPVTLWPPFGLRNSSSAVEALGKVGESDNEDFVRNVGRATQPATSQKKEDATSKYMKSGVILGPMSIASLKTEKPIVQSKSSNMSVLDAALATKIPVQVVPKTTAARTQPVTVPTSSSSVSMARDIAPNAIAKTGNVSKSLTTLPSSKTSAAKVAPKTAVIKTVIPSASRGTSGPSQAISSMNAIVSNQNINKSVNDVLKTASKNTPTSVDASSKAVLRNVSTKHYVVPRDTARKTQSNPTVLNDESAAKVVQRVGAHPLSSLKSTDISVLPQCDSKVPLPSTLPINYPKPENGNDKTVNQSRANTRIATAKVSISQNPSKEGTDPCRPESNT